MSECGACDGSGLAYRDNPHCAGYLLAEECDACDGSGLEAAKPTWIDLFGIDPDYCEGRDVSEWLDAERGEA